MNHYMVSYDLVKPGKDYSGLTARLEQLHARRILYSQWEINTSARSREVLEDLTRFIDANDRLLVTGLNGEASWTGLLISDQEFKNRMAA